MSIRTTILCLAAYGLVPVALAQPAGLAVETRYTELVGGRCKFISEEKGTGEEALKRCPGHGDLEVETFASHTLVSLSFRFSRTQRAENGVEGWSLGRRVEWRGLKGNKGFEPYAAVVRVLMKDPEAATPQPDGEILAVIRVDPREAEACVAATWTPGPTRRRTAWLATPPTGSAPLIYARATSPLSSAPGPAGRMH